MAPPGSRRSGVGLAGQHPASIRITKPASATAVTPTPPGSDDPAVGPKAKRGMARCSRVRSEYGPVRAGQLTHC